MTTKELEFQKLGQAVEALTDNQMAELVLHWYSVRQKRNPNRFIMPCFFANLARVYGQLEETENVSYDLISTGVLQLAIAYNTALFSDDDVEKILELIEK